MAGPKKRSRAHRKIKYARQKIRTEKNKQRARERHERKYGRQPVATAQAGNVAKYGMKTVEPDHNTG